MQPRDIERLDPHWGVEARLIESVPRQQLHDAAGQLDLCVDAIGQPVDTGQSPFDAVCSFLTLGRRDEAFFSAKVLPVHDTFMKNGGAINSRFLAVDSRNPFKEYSAHNRYPLLCMRTYFLIVGPGEGLPHDPANIFPYFVTTDHEAPSYDLSFRRGTSDVCYARYSADMPLETAYQPHRVHDMDMYQAMAKELRLATQLGGEGA